MVAEEGNDGDHRFARIEGSVRILKNRLNPAGKLGAVNRGHILSVEEDTTACHFFQPENQFSDRAFSAPGLSH